IDKDFYSTITFTLPVTIAGGQSTSAFSAEVLGVVVKDAFGVVDIDFDTSTQHFTFANAQYTGSFDFNVTSLVFGDLGSGASTVNWYGQVSNAVETPIASGVPEPGPLLLLAAGLFSVAFLNGRSRRAVVSR
ncbi:MAG TPA: PEP-CTERM sorting domain-containing protein, partial [Terriglobales bacterium]|nr:PEP-CTERM sorting domain-containing protein [Terriglobales bacterium]